MGRFMYEKVVDTPPALVWGPNPAPTTSQSIKTTGYNALLRFTASISPTMINTLSMVGTHDKPRLTAINGELPSDVTLNRPFNGDPHNHAPAITLAGGWSGMGTSLLRRWMPVTARLRSPMTLAK